MKTEIFSQPVWTRESVIAMLEEKKQSHLAMQIKENGIFCPDILAVECSLIPAVDLWKWFDLHQRLLATIYTLLADKRVIEVQVLPPEEESHPNTFKLRLEKDISGE